MMKKLFYLLVSLFTCAAILGGCGGKDAPETTTEDRNLAIESAGNDDQVDGNYNEEDTELTLNDSSEEDTGEEVTTSGNEESTTASESDNPDDTTEDSPATHRGSGTFNGFADSHTIEVTMGDGNYRTFFVYEEDIYNELSRLSEQGESPVIQFVYTSRAGQAIPEIIELN